MKKVIALLLAATMLMGILCGCNNTAVQEQSGEQIDNEEVYEIAFIIKSLQAVLWVNMGEAAEQAGQDYDNINVEVMAPQTPMNVDEQIQLVEQAITKGVDCICIAPCDSTAIAPVLEKANQAGIMVITPNTKANGADITCFVGVENYDVGYTLGIEFCEKLGGEGNVLLLEGKPGVSTSEERVAGFNDAIANYPGINLLDSQATDWDRAKANTIMENWLQIYDDIDGVMSLTKDTGLGAIEAMKAAGRNDEILSMTFDIDDETIEAIQNGDLYGTGNQNERSQGYMAVTMARLALMGYIIPDNVILPITIETADTLNN